MADFVQKKFEAARECFEKHHATESIAYQGVGQSRCDLQPAGRAQEGNRSSAESINSAIENVLKLTTTWGSPQRAQQMNTMAISAYKEWLKLAPEMVDANINLGNLYMEMKNVGLAIQCFQSALRHDPKSEKAMKCLQTAQSTQKTSRKEASPFGRLVDVRELEQQQHP